MIDNYPIPPDNHILDLLSTSVAIVVLLIVAYIMSDIKAPEGKTFWEHNTGCGWGLILLGAFLGILWFSILSVMGERME